MSAVKATPSDKPVIVLFRHDLRLADNRALSAAAASGRPVLPVFIPDEESEGTRPLGGARRWWLHKSLERLAEKLAELGAPLTLRKGKMVEVVKALVDESGADTLLWNRRYDPAGMAADKALKQWARESDLAAESFDGHLLHEPSLLTTGNGGPYKVYTPFWRALASSDELRPPLGAPRALKGCDGPIEGMKLSALELLPSQPDWAGGLCTEWTPGEEGAQARLRSFFADALAGYGENRDLPGTVTTSRLSPHLAHGEITPYQIWDALKQEASSAPGGDIEKFRKEIAWREFCHHLLFHNPDLATKNYNSDFDAFPWRPDKALLAAWQRGRTGYPIVDAGMRELWQTGWMHNRVRMVVASFLTKHLLQDWRQGEAWFWDTLVDADPASNPANWQWVAGSGADAAPYFRIFNPVLQGEKFDPDGAYVRRFVPELAKLPDRFIHKPWQAPETALSRAGVKLGETYPVPAVDHGRARERALAAHKEMKGDA